MTTTAERTMLVDVPVADAAAFEPVLTALGGYVARLEVIEPGMCAFATRGPSRYFGGDMQLARLVSEAVAVEVSGARVGVADGIFAARLAAAAGHAGVVVPEGGTAAFLAPHSVATLGVPGFTTLLVQLGVRTLGDLARLPAPDVLGRFGEEGMAALRLARGEDDRPLVPADAPADLSVAMPVDPPAERSDIVAFCARSLADELTGKLAAAGLVCTVLTVCLETDHAETSVRTWRHDDGIAGAAIVDRVRWQVDGWLACSRRPTAGITSLRLAPECVRHDTGRQIGFWGGSGEADRRAGRAFARLQAMLGAGAVLTAELTGGRSPVERVCLVPWSGERPGEGASTPPPDPAPWPGRVPPPAPAVVHARPPLLELLDAGGSPVRVDRCALLSATPAVLVTPAGDRLDVNGWSSPWPLDDRWWDPPRHVRTVRMQVVTTTGRAHLLTTTPDGRWSAEATYD